MKNSICFLQIIFESFPKNLSLAHTIARARIDYKWLEMARDCYKTIKCNKIKIESLPHVFDD